MHLDESTLLAGTNQIETRRPPQRYDEAEPSRRQSTRSKCHDDACLDSEPLLVSSLGLLKYGDQEMRLVIRCAM